MSGNRSGICGYLQVPENVKSAQVELYYAITYETIHRETFLFPLHVFSLSCIGNYYIFIPISPFLTLNFYYVKQWPIKGAARELICDCGNPVAWCIKSVDRRSSD